MKLKKLPSSIRVKVIQEKSGVYFADLPDYDVFTEADTPIDLILNVNDLIYSFFGIPQRDWGKIFYMPRLSEQRKLEQDKLPLNPLLFSVLAKPSFNKYDFK